MGPTDFNERDMTHFGWLRHAADLTAELLFQRRPPGHELEPHAIVDHGEAAGRKRDSLAIDARDLLALSRWPIGEPSLLRPWLSCCPLD